MIRTGYYHPDYAGSLAEFGEPIHLARADGWVLRRPISGTTFADAMGCYPVFGCSDWSLLADGLELLSKDLVSIALVPDPFGSWDVPTLERCFDRVTMFKEHFVVDASELPEKYVSKHHRYYARKALKVAHVELCDRPTERVDEWAALYANLVSRHALKGIKAFSRESFKKQLTVPGLVMLRVLEADVCVGTHLWFIQDGVAHSHLMAMNERGYAINAAYGLYWEAIRLFREHYAGTVRWINLGAGAGASGPADTGLTQFKRGWANASRPVYFCGRVLDRARYTELCQDRAPVRTDYFPAYRHGELA